MAKIAIINTFNNVLLDEGIKPLVICDIDNTFIRCEFDLDYFRNILKDENNMLSDFDVVIDKTVNDKEAIQLMNNAYNLGFLKQTDPSGFHMMLRKINRMGGKFIFLTARSREFHNKTLDDLKKVGLANCDKYEIHYTGNQCTKGEYIKNHNLTHGYEHISFIDDYLNYLMSVFELHPNINCYLFRYN